MTANFVDLYTSAVKNKDVSKLKLVPEILLDDYEQEARTWLLTYVDKYGTTPSARVVEETAAAQPCFMRTSIYATEPVKATYEQATRWLVLRHVKRELANLEENADGEGGYPVGQLLELAKRANAVSTTEHDTLLRMDRDAIYSQQILEGAIDWGLSYLDEVTGGILPGEVALLGARTGVGKSLLVCRQAVRWARQGKRVMVISAEMPAVQLTYRMDAMLGGFNPRLFRMKGSAAALSGHRKDVQLELDLIKDAGGDILFPRTKRLTVGSLVSACHDQSPDALIVDGVYLLQPDDGGASSSWERTKAASNAIKQLVIDLNIPSLTTSQFKREGKESGFDLESIAYSDALGQDSDLVIAAAKEPGGNKINLEVIKSRNGETGGSTQIENDWNKMTVTEVPWTRTTLVLGKSS